DGDDVRPSDLQLLLDRGWAEAPPEPAPPEPEHRASAAPPGARGRAETARASVSRRTRGREVALQVLYLTEQNPAADPAEIDRFTTRGLRDPKLCEFPRALVDGVRAHQAALDEKIQAVAENWRIDRMAAIDRNILRLGAFEMLHRRDVPRRVAIN